MHIYDLKGQQWTCAITLRQFEERIAEYESGNRSTSFEVTRDAKGVTSRRTLFAAEVAITLTLQKNKQAS